MKRKLKNFFLVILYLLLATPIFLFGIFFIIKNPESEFYLPLGVLEGFVMVMLLLIIFLFYEEPDNQNLK